MEHKNTKPKTSTKKASANKTATKTSSTKKPTTKKVSNKVIFTERKRGLFGLPLSFTVYKVSEAKLTVEEGFLNKTFNECYIYKIEDATLTMTLFERLFNVGTIILNTQDITTPVIKLMHIRNAEEIKEFILETAEECRMKRRTLNMNGIGNMQITGEDF